MKTKHLWWIGGAVAVYFLFIRKPKTPKQDSLPVGTSDPGVSETHHFRSGLQVKPRPLDGLADPSRYKMAKTARYP